jgi:hypothetical protein
MPYTALELATSIMQMWNETNVFYIQDKLHKNCRYGSQWVLNDLEGELEIMVYLGDKMQTMKTSIANKETNVSAALAWHPNYDNTPCVILSQTTNGTTTKVLIEIKSKNGLITDIDICGVPRADMAKLM